MPKKKKKQRFNKAEDDCGESNQNKNLGDEIKTLKKDNLIQLNKLSDLEATIKSLEAVLKNQEAELTSQKANLAEEVTCMVCLELPGPGKVPVCVNGHIICQICIRKLIKDRKNCPSCMGSLTPQRFSLLANNICDMLDYSCPNKDLGCTEFPGRQGQEQHLRTVCKYEKNISCPKRNCDIKVSLADHRDHFLKCITTRYLQEKRAVIQFRKFDIPLARYLVCGIHDEIDDDVFFIFIMNQSKDIIVQNVHRGKKYSVSCKVYNEDASRSFEGKTVPLGTPEGSCLYQNNSLKVPDCLIEHLEGQDGQRFQVDLKIEKLKN